MVSAFQPREGIDGKDIKNIPVVCKHCRSENFVKEGYRKTEHRGKIQKYFCKDCQRYFTADTGFYRMRNDEKKIAMAVDMYLSNLSSRKMRNQLMRHFEVKISHVSVLDWVRRYVLKVQKFVDRLSPELSGRFYADETEINRGRRKDNKNDIFWCSIDWESRYINATLYSPYHQNMVDATAFMMRIRKSGIPKHIQTDGLPFYPKAFRGVFYSKSGERSEQPRHIANNVSKTKKHNVRIETVFSKLKDRVADFRGLKALWSAPIIMAGLVLQHNFIEPHTTTGKLPCELAGLEMVTGINRWLGLIKLASFAQYQDKIPLI